ncbi:CaiB/BaiF CoA-transferase family protein [Comamonadaceae bacterium G21597-S1]|nr:CaiB/BaiF CoA-transferase family protein [Comamonadaceae bacterium G21597-S1]
MGPLHGLRVIEFQGSGPGPFAGMMLADMGADVLLLERAGPPNMGKYGERRFETMMRGKRSVTLDLKADGAAEAVLELVGHAHALVDPYRPRTLERRGLGPSACLARNPALIYGRMTGWGQSGPRAATAGHDINYIALSGVLNAIGRAGEPPTVPLNLIGDMGGGGMLLAFGIACGLIEASRTGRGQVVDAAMFEGASLLGTLFRGMMASGRWKDVRGENHLDGSAPWYTSYETADGYFMAVGANEDGFYQLLLEGLDLDKNAVPDRKDRLRWPQIRAIFTQAFKTRTRSQWRAVFDHSDACVTPVLSFAEASVDAHAIARESFIDVNGIVQPSPAPRFSRNAADMPAKPPLRGEGGQQALRDWGFDTESIDALRRQGVDFMSDDELAQYRDSPVSADSPPTRQEK